MLSDQSAIEASVINITPSILRSLASSQSNDSASDVWNQPDLDPYEYQVGVGDVLSGFGTTLN